MFKKKRTVNDVENTEAAEVLESAAAAEASTSDAGEQRDLSKLKKKELLEILLKQGEEIDRLREQVAELEARLADREFDFDKVGSIAEASLAVTDIFKEAEKAAKIYLENIRRRVQ